MILCLHKQPSALSSGWLWSLSNINRRLFIQALFLHNQLLLFLLSNPFTVSYWRCVCVCMRVCVLECLMQAIISVVQNKYCNVILSSKAFMFFIFPLKSMQVLNIIFFRVFHRRTQWLLGLRRWSAATLFLGCGFETGPGAWMSVSCECCVLAGSWEHHSSRVLPSVQCLSVIVKPRQRGGPDRTGGSWTMDKKTSLPILSHFFHKKTLLFFLKKL